MNELILSKIKNGDIRSIDIDGKVWYAVSDVAKALGFRWGLRNINRAGEEHRAKAKIKTNRGLQELNMIDEYAIDMFIKRSISKRAKEKRNTYIILNKDTGLYKIGRSEDVSKRFRNLETISGCNLELLHVFDKDIESELHQMYAKYRIIGEWFMIPLDLLPVNSTLKVGKSVYL